MAIHMTRFEQADRLKALPPYLFARLKPLFDEKRAAGWDMIDFGIGDPDISVDDRKKSDNRLQHGTFSASGTAEQSYNFTLFNPE